eukprot:CAMPEP_0202864410 /NCGR_PEP_ID=MMETSP1391-20130828/4662_1 /ASSEMBLY_ACC=CAM_ASM_000867 /TAXON_ID=1034604 /ORGANISM="Chlamydomonas leiostraca, Strain SAG 11-49" /LENGTH=452 /DNA_ID=CAMNT_0049544145 /DNA_START=218 /DNA_END=1576 /DNA_ORIENTATION=+
MSAAAEASTAASTAAAVAGSKSRGVPTGSELQTTWASTYIDGSLRIEGEAGGPLTGVTVAIKDLFDVAGQKTGFGNPVWRDSHQRATATCPAVTRLLRAGATVTGRTHMDELAYSLNGENAHYGVPPNPAAPGRIPGGSSSGSATAVAAGHVDIGLGSDTGGSVRVPASYCGVWGVRPTHGRVPLEGARPLAPSFDTVGWFARTPDLLRGGGTVLLDPPGPSTAHPHKLTKWLVAVDAFELAQPETAAALRQFLEARRGRLEGHLMGASSGAGAAAGTEVVVLGETHIAMGNTALSAAGLGALTSWLDVFRVCQAGEIWREHGAWVTAHAPNFGPGIRERFDMASRITPQEWEAAASKRALITREVRALLGSNTVLVVPSAPGPAPLVATPPATLDAWRTSLISLTCVAGLSGSPQISVPGATVGGLPVGLGLIGPPGSDEALMEAAGVVFG